MTIGIGCCGRQAGLAVLRALETAEKIGTGAIRGYAVFAAITQNGELIRAETQRGGVKNLFAEIPLDVAEAECAGIISSNPDRPEPLSQFIAADPKIGLVTGHRFPQALSKNNKPLNIEVLEQLSKGLSAQEAVSSILDVSPEADAGLIAVSAKSEIGFANTARVSRRSDAGSAYRFDEKTKTGVAVLHNAIFPKDGLAALVAEVAMTTMQGQVEENYFTVRQGTPVVHGIFNAVEIDKDFVARKIITTDAQILTGHHDCAAIYLDALVLQGGVEIGKVWLEPYTVVENGKIISLDGQMTLQVGFRKTI